MVRNRAPLRVSLDCENDPRRVDFENSLNSTKESESKGIYQRMRRPRRSRFGYWFGHLTTTGGEIDDNGV